MPFQYDVFLSYRRKAAYVDWLNDFFYDRFETELGNSLDHAPAIFCDRKSIEIGTHWTDELRTALGSARCMVGVWAPEYFRSHWCYNEWRNFQRQRDGFVLPLRWTDNKKFPVDARLLTGEDFSSYALTGPGFRKTEKFVEFQLAIREFAAKVARVIERAPAEPPPFTVQVESAPNADRADELITFFGSTMVHAAAAL